MQRNFFVLLYIQSIQHRKKEQKETKNYENKKTIKLLREKQTLKLNYRSLALVMWPFLRKNIYFLYPIACKIFVYWTSEQEYVAQKYTGSHCILLQRFLVKLFRYTMNDDIKV